jgi:hypothetical protein
MDPGHQGCGCCEGAHVLRSRRNNPPGRPAVHYRLGEYAHFREAMLARLSSAGLPALAHLRTRDDDDPAIALCDAGAVMLDVLGFYQERIANESWLRTAVERRSILELGRLIGYRPSPGVAASVFLAFSLEDAPGVPSLAAKPVQVPVGTRCQSVPGPGELPQTFETTGEITARVEWNAMPLQTRRRQVPGIGTRELYVAGIATQVQVGDAIVLVGDERLADLGSERWDVRIVSAVEVDAAADRTCLRWAEGLGQGGTAPSTQGLTAHVLRLRSTLFGHNAADPRMLRFQDDTLGLTTGNGTEWKNYRILGTRLDLDGAFPKVLPGSWLVLAGGRGGPGSPSLPGWVELYRAKTVTQLSRAQYGLSGKVTRVVPDTNENLDRFEDRLRETLVLAQSEELAITEFPVTHPAYGKEVVLARRDEFLAPGQAVAVNGRRQRLRVQVDDPGLKFHPDGADAVAVRAGDGFIVAAPPMRLVGGEPTPIAGLALEAVLQQASAQSLRWRLFDRHGRPGELQAPASAVRLQPSHKDDPVVAVVGVIESVSPGQGEPHTHLILETAIEEVFDRASVAVCANLAPASHGESVGELAGSGDASLPNQSFVLRQAPLTHVSAGTPSGRRSTLEVRVDGQLWTEVDSLYARGPEERVYTQRQDDDDRTTVSFGDGLEGSRLSTGRDNIRFGYRRSLGAAGNVGAGQITSLLGRPLGVKSVSNPASATGGQDREPLDEARHNAPLTVLTLGRAVSLQDYTDFARGFAGIGKARADWAGRGAQRGILLSLAGASGEALDEASIVLVRLRESLRRHGDPLVPLWLRSYRSVHFRLAARIKVAADAETEVVLAAVDSALRQHFAFTRRDLVQAVSLDEVMAVVQRVRGVVAVDVDRMFRLDPGAPPSLQPRLFAQPPKEDGEAQLAAELLTLEPGPVALEAMP